MGNSLYPKGFRTECPQWQVFPKCLPECLTEVLALTTHQIQRAESPVKEQFFLLIVLLSLSLLFTWYGMKQKPKSWNGRGQGHSWPQCGHTPFCKGMCLTAMKLTRAEGVAVFDSEELRLMWWLYLGLKSFNFLVEMVFYDLRLTGGLSFTYEWTEKSCILSKFQPGAGKDELD